MKIISLMLTALMTLSATTGAFAQSAYGTQKVVYHINYPGGDSNKAYKGAMRNIQNHINAVGAENMIIKVVMHGNGVGLVQAANSNDELAATIDGLKHQNVAFNVCANTLRGRNIDRATDLYDVEEADVVPSGVAELSHLQHQGFTYIKP